MAIQKSKTLANGTTGDYWKVTSEAYDKVTHLCTWVISLYLDHAHGTSHAPTLGLDKIYTYVATPEELMGNRTTLAYTQIKAKAASLVIPPFSPPDTDAVPFDSDLIDGIDV